MTEDIARERAKLFLGHLEHAQLNASAPLAVQTLTDMFMAAYHEGAIEAYGGVLSRLRGEKKPASVFVESATRTGN